MEGFYCEVFTASFNISILKILDLVEPVVNTYCIVCRVNCFLGFWTKAEYITFTEIFIPLICPVVLDLCRQSS